MNNSLQSVGILEKDTNGEAENNVLLISHRITFTPIVATCGASQMMYFWRGASPLSPKRFNKVGCRFLATTYAYERAHMRALCCHTGVVLTHRCGLVGDAAMADSPFRFSKLRSEWLYTLVTPVNNAKAAKISSVSLCLVATVKKNRRQVGVIATQSRSVPCCSGV